jgi:hypothetical protein
LERFVVRVTFGDLKFLAIEIFGSVGIWLGLLLLNGQDSSYATIEKGSVSRD